MKKQFTSIVAVTLMMTAEAARIPLVKNNLDHEQIAAQVEHMANRFLGGESTIDIQNYADWSYLVEVEIGTPPQKFMMGPDTVSTDSWVLGKNCWSLPCFWMSLYDNTKSSTYVANGTDFNKTMVDFLMSHVEGNVSSDTFKLGDLVAENFKFGEVNTLYGTTLTTNKFNGVLGLAYNTDSQSISGLDPFLLQANPADKSFSLYLRREPKQSYMVVPGMDTDNFEIIKEHKVNNKEYFQMKLDSIKQGDVVVQQEGMQVGIMNTYDSIVGFSDLLQPMLEKFVVYEDCSNMDRLPDVTFTIDGAEYTLTPSEYVIKRMGKCISGISMFDVYKYKRTVPSNTIILGNVFLQKYFPMFDMDKDTITFQKEKTATIANDVEEAEI